LGKFSANFRNPQVVKLRAYHEVVKNLKSSPSTKPIEVYIPNLPSQTILINGKVTKTPQLPYGVYGDDYLSMFHPEAKARLMDELDKNYGAGTYKDMNQDVMPFHFGQGYKHSSENPSSAKRLDPSKFFESMFPNTFREQKGSYNFLRFEAVTEN